jgi:hypothetical protein
MLQSLIPALTPTDSRALMPLETALMSTYARWDWRAIYAMKRPPSLITLPPTAAGTATLTINTILPTRLPRAANIDV